MKNKKLLVTIGIFYLIAFWGSEPYPSDEWNPEKKKMLVNEWGYVILHHLK